MIRFRAPQYLRDWIEGEARANGRSMNAELVWMIEFVKSEKEKFEAEERSEAAEAKRVAEEALRIAKEALSLWESNALVGKSRTGD